MGDIKGNLYTTYFASGKSKGIKIAIVRYKPKWLDFHKENILHIDKLSPSEKLLKFYNDNRDSIAGDDSPFGAWFSFEQAFKFEINNLDSMKIALKRVQNALDNGEDITLICYEKECDRCHRSLLGKHFEELGYNVKEL